MAAIKGITIEIGANTTKLAQALRTAQAPVNKLQSELKQVERLLKMDPGNTALLKQKMELLSSSVEETKINLKEMKAALAEADKDPAAKSTAGYRRLQQEIVKTEQRLRQMVNEAARTKIMASSIGQAATKMNALGKTATMAGNKLRGASMAVGLIGGAAVAVTAEFDSSMAKVRAVSGATGKEFDALRAKAREMGEKTKFSASESAEAMNYMAMAGWKTGEMLSGIEGVMNLAAASGEDLATTSDIVTDALTAMGYAAKDSGRLADVMAAASSNANTNVGMMGETFKYAAAVAGSMGYSMEDLALATGLMANSGIKASQAGTSLRSMISRMAAPTKQVASAMKQVGVSMSDSNGKARPFRDVLVDLRKGMKGMTEEEKTQIATNIAGKNAMSGFLAIVNSSDKDFQKLTKAIDESDGAAQNMADTMINNLGGQVTILKSQLQELAIGAGDTLVPMVKKATSAAQELTDWFNNLSDAEKEAAVKMGLVAGAAGPALIVFGGMAACFNNVVTATATCAGKFAELTKVEGEATAATKALGIAQKSLPFVAAAAGAALLATALVKAYESTHKATLAAKDHAKARQESVQTIKSEAKENEFYLQKLDELAGVEDKTASQKKLMKAYVDQLNGSIKGLNLKYDEEKDKLSQTTKEIQKKIEAMKQEALAAAYTKNAKKAYEDYANAEMKAAEAKDELALKQQKWNSLSESEKQVNGQLLQDINALKVQVDDYNTAMSTAIQDANKWTNAGAMQGDAWKSLKAEAAKAGIEIPKSVKTGLKKGMYTIPQSVNELQALVKFDKMKNKATGDAKKTADKLAKGLEDGSVTAQKAASKLEKAVNAELKKGDAASKKAGKETGKSYASGIGKAKSDAKKQGQGLKSNAQTGAKGSLDKQGTGAGKGYGTGLSGQAKAAMKAAKKLNDAAKSATNKPNLLKSIGSSIGSGLAAGMRSGLGAVKAAASRLIEEANKAARAKAKVNSPSKLFRDGVGIAIPEGLAAGIKKGMPMVKKASNSMIVSANTAAMNNMSVSAANRAAIQEFVVRNEMAAQSAGPVYNIGDVTLDVKELEDVATIENIVTVLRRAKAFA